MRTETTQTPESVLNELRSLMNEAEKVLDQAQGDAGCNFEATLTALRERLAAAQERISDVYQGVKEEVAAGAKRVDATVRENPYQALAIAAGIGLLAGVLIGRRSNSGPQ
jgi:ElaB/YqjD/DUF883 family membrane-anchored ribosome-binding protein